MELIELYEDDGGLYYVTEDSWHFGLDDDEQHQFGVIFEIINMYDATGEDEFEDFPYLVEASIVGNDPSPEFAEEGGARADDNLSLVEGAYRYGGGVPITHTLMDGIATGGSKGLGPLLKGIDKDDYKIEETEAKYGTVAAQRGPGSVNEYPVFRTDEAAKQYVQNIVDSGRLNALGMMIGFILDRPINMMGESGWRTMAMYVNGPNYRGNNPTTSKLKSKLLR